MSDEPWVTYGGARRRIGSHFNIRGIAQGVQVYESVRGSLPAGTTRDETGWPLHGWMTMILPYVEEGALYQRVRFGEPWDSPDNDPKVLEAMATPHSGEMFEYPD